MVSQLKYTLTAAFMVMKAMYVLSQPIPADSLAGKRVFTNLQSALESPSEAFRLDLSKQKLEEIPPELFALENLQELILNRNKLKTIPPEISQLTNLQSLQIQHNELEVIPQELLSLNHLTRLDLADNLIERIPEEINKLNALQTLALWDNPISYYPGTLSELPELKVLDLLHNDISADTQNTLKSLLPGVKLIMSPPCACNDGGE